MTLVNRLRALFPKKIKIWHKLTLACFAFGLPITVLLVVLIRQQNKDIEFARKEMQGTEFLRPLRQLLGDTLSHQMAVLRQQANDEAGGRKDVNALAAAIEEDIRAIDQLDKKYGGQLSQEDRSTTAMVKSIKDGWEQVKGWKKKSAADRARDYSALVGNTRALVSLVGDTSNLILDPDLDSYYMMDSVLLKLPDLQETLGALAVFGLEAAGQGNRKLTDAERTDLIVKRASLLATAAALNSKTQGMPAAFRNDSTPSKSLEATLRGPLTTFVEGGNSYAALLEEKVLNAANAAALSKQDAARGPEALDSSFELWDKSVAALDGLLKQRIDGFQQAKTYALIGVSLALAVAILVVVFIVRGVTGQVAAMSNLFEAVRAGNYQARAEILSRDELGTMAGGLNVMLDNTLTLIQSRDEKEQIQQSITKLLEEVAGVADGDLTKEAEVTADMTGAIADSFNFMIDQLRKIISNVKSATRHVSSSAHEVVTTAQQLASRSESQTMQIVNTAAAVDEMATSILQVSENAVLSATVAQQALTNARQGNDTVQKTVQGMNRIRDQVQETAKRIKRLGESSQEIGQIIQIIDDIADRTSILALNASIQAAMAGEAGRGFAVVAEEVERLADRSTDATKKIVTLVKTIQSETHEAINAMEKGIQEVVDGSKMANLAGNTLSEIEGISTKLADLIQAISLASKQQARASEGVAKSMNEISEVTQDTALGTKQAAEAVNQLAGLAENLSESVSTFRLPQAFDDGASLAKSLGGDRAAPPKANGNGRGRKPVGAN